MFLSRFVGRTALLAAAKSESSAAAAAAAATNAAGGHNPLEQLFEFDRCPDDEKPVYGTLGISLPFLFSNFLLF